MLHHFFTKIIELRWYVLMLFGFLSLFGFHSLSQIKIDAIPDITNKQVIVNSKTFAMDPSRVEKAVTYPIEAELYGIPGLLEMRSISKFGLSQIMLIFRDEIDIYFARNQVLQRISTLNDQLPNGINPEIAPLTTGIGEIIMYRVYHPSGESDLTELRTIQEYKIARELKKVQGVAEIDTIGGFKRELHLNVTPNQLTKYGLTTRQLGNQLKTIGENFGGGYIEQNGEQKIVRSLADINSFDDVGNFPIKIDYQGQQVALKHIVEVSLDSTQRLGSATSAAQEVVIGTVMMQSGANAKEVLTQIKQEIKALNKRNLGAKIEILYDRQFLIDATIKTVMKNVAEGILLVIGVLCLLLGNFRAGMIIASSLLFSVFILAACMNIFGISANLMSLGAIDFGLLVDSSVVLVEYIIANVALRQNKENKILSIAELSAKVAKPILIGIFIIILVYVPILMFSGIEGKTFRPMAMNVIIAMTASLLVAFLLMPVLSYFFLGHAGKHKEHWLFLFIKSQYERLLEWVFRHCKIVIFSSITFFIVSIVLFSRMPTDFLPDLNEGDAVYTVVMQNSSTSLLETTKILQNLETVIADEKEVEKTFSRVGISQTGLDLMPQNSADLFVIFKKDHKSDAKNIADKIYAKLKKACLECDIANSQPIKMRFNEMLEGSRADLSLKIFGEDLNILMDVTRKIRNLFEKNANIKAIEEDFINSIRQGIFLDAVPNYKKMMQHQVSIADINNDLKDAMAGVQIGNYYASEFPIPIKIHLNEKNRNDVNVIGNMPIALADGGNFPLSDIVNLQESEGITSIPRLFGKRYSSLSIYLNDTNYSGFIQSAEKKIIEDNILPEGYYLEWGGRFKNLNSAKKQIMLVVPFIILIIFAILYHMFGSMKRVMVMFSTIPFALSGAITLLFMCDIPITISVYIGFIALIGISLLNSIILNDSFKQNNDIKLTCLSRLRPILMTAIVASLGFLPMAFGGGIGAEVQQPIAITVIGGIISSTIATLILNPVLIRNFVEE